MPELSYPVDIVFETEEGESVTTLNSEEEMWYSKRRLQEDGKLESVSRCEIYFNVEGS